MSDAEAKPHKAGGAALGQYDIKPGDSLMLVGDSNGMALIKTEVFQTLVGKVMKGHNEMPPVFIYGILTIAVFTLSPLLYEILRRIPFIRWCILGEKKENNR